MVLKGLTKVEQNIKKRFKERTRLSKTYDQKAKQYLPGGDTRNATFYKPYPVYMNKGEGCYVYDCDGNRYIDFLNNYTSLIHGHVYPDIVKRGRTQLEEGTVLGAPAMIQFEHAEILCNRIPSLEMVRYCNSGTEATLYAMRTARAFTKKDMIVKMDGGYNGTHDSAEVNINPDLTAKAFPKPYLASKGVPTSVLNDISVVPFNDLDSVETTLKKHQNKIAGIIMEPMLGSRGMIPPLSDYLKGMRELANRYQVLLIFDEIMTFRLTLGGLHAFFGVEADLIALGKIIGGGFPVGAFGGKREILGMYDPSRTDYINHSGTFNGNNITMAAGVAALTNYDQEAIDKVNRLGEKLREGFNTAFQTAGIKGQVTGLGSLLQVHWKAGTISNAKEAFIGRERIKGLIELFHLEMMNRGIFAAPRGMFCISTPMTEKEIDVCIKEFGVTLEVLKPYVLDLTPDLIEN